MKYIIEKEFRVTGLSQFQYKELQTRLVWGMYLRIRPQPANRYDPNAIGVFTVNNTEIGWIPKSDNPPLRELMTLAGVKELDVRVVDHVLNKEKVHDSKLVIRVSIPLDLSAYTAVGVREILSKLDQAGFTNRASPSVSGAKVSTTGKSPYTTDVPKIATDGYAMNPQEYEARAYPNSISTVDNRIGTVATNRTNEIELLVPLSEKTIANLKQQLKEETIMTKIVDTNKIIATQAAFNEAGRIFLNQVTKFAAKQAPLMVKGYIDTPVGKLALANATVLAVQHFRANDARLVRLANAALGQAYQEVYQSFDIEQFIEGFLNNETIKAALKSVEEVKEAE